MSQDKVRTICSSEHLNSFKDKVIIMNTTFVPRPITGRVIEIGPEFLVLEQRDGRKVVARIDSIVSFAMTRNQPKRQEAV